MTTISGAGAHGAVAGADRLPASKEGNKGYHTVDAIKDYVSDAIAEDPENPLLVYIDALLANANALIYKSGIDCSANPDYPAADAGWMYKVTVAGKIGGASGLTVKVGDTLICNADSTASGNQATVGANWTVLQVNLDFAEFPDEVRTLSGNPLSFPDGLAITNATFIGDTDGSVQFGIGDVTTGDSYWKVEAGSSNSGPIMFVVSDDTNADGNFAAKGTGGIWFGNGSGRLGAFLDSGGVTANVMSFIGAVAGAAPKMKPNGTDTNINANVTAKGTGSVVLENDGEVIAKFDDSGGTGVNYLRVIASITGVGVQMLPAGSDTNIPLHIGPAGNSALTSHKPDSTSTGGNSRGNYATDWQRQRSAASQVASGANAAIVGGKDNQASGAESVAGGASNITSAQTAVAFGNANTASGFAACAIGNGNTASGSYSRAGGRNAYANALGKDAWSGQGFSAVLGSNQQGKQTLLATTTDATQTAMTVDGNSGGGTNQILLQDNSVMVFSALITARDGSGTKFAGYRIDGVIRRNANAAATSLLASNVTVLYETNAAWDVDVVAGTSFGVLNVRVTGEASLTVYWGATVTFHEVVHA